MTNNDTSLTKEIARKSFHLFILLLPLGYYFLGKIAILKILLPLTFIVVLLDYLRRKSPAINNVALKIFKPIMRIKEQDPSNFSGMSHMLVAASLIFMASKQEIAVIAFFILAICDSSASLIGKSFASKPFFEKSTAGSLAFFISGAIIILFASAILDLGPAFLFFALFSLFVATIVEARPSVFQIDDNFSIPIAFTLPLSMFDYMWGIV